MTKPLNNEYWENRYQTDKTGWDTGEITTPLKEYIDQIENKKIKILIPGAGNGYEFDYLVKKGFTNIYVVDIAETPVKNIRNRNPEIVGNILLADFFKLDTTFDLIIEQTFFCALDPKLRNNYVTKMLELLNPNGKLAGLLFNFPLTEEGPPFGGSKEEYLDLFSENFTIKTLEKAYNSIKPRKDRELFFIFEKK